MTRMVNKLRHVLAPAITLAASFALQGCGTLYVAQAAKGQLQLLTARKPIDRVLANPKTSPELRSRLESVQAARAFAWRELGLPNNKSYTSYADLGREYVVWTVTATPEFSVEPHEWCFPVVGCVAYRGYFKEVSARKFAQRWHARGYDTTVDGTPAYSTLGKFNDPIMNTMLSYGDDELASILFHELSHQLVYIADDTAFNEAFAVAVEQEGLARWLKARGRESELARYRKRRQRQAESLGVIRRYRAELEALYASGVAVDVMRARKASVFAQLVEELKGIDLRYSVKSGIVEDLEGQPNNARLASLATYYDCVPGFEKMLAANDHDLPRFYASVRDLAKLPRAERRARVCSSAEAS
jgi:predicted aminopeptidase